MTATETLQFDASTQTAPVTVVAVRRRTIDAVLIGIGVVAFAALAVSAVLLTWGNRFSSDYVRKELSSQHVSFPDAAALTEDGRTDLLGHAGNAVDTGREAEAYASYIDGHLEAIAGGATYADLGSVQRTATAAVTDATKAGAPASEIAELQATATKVTAERTSLFQGETLRGLLLSAYAWSTVGTIAGIAAIAAYIAAAVTLVLVIAGLMHLRRTALIPATVPAEQVAP